MREAQSTETNVMDPAQTAGKIVTIMDTSPPSPSHRSRGSKPSNTMKGGNCTKWHSNSKYAGPAQLFFAPLSLVRQTTHQIWVSRQWRLGPIYTFSKDFNKINQSSRGWSQSSSTKKPLLLIYLIVVWEVASGKWRASKGQMVIIIIMQGSGFLASRVFFKLHPIIFQSSVLNLWCGTSPAWWSSALCIVRG